MFDGLDGHEHRRPARAVRLSARRRVGGKGNALVVQPAQGARRHGHPRLQRAQLGLEAGGRGLPVGREVERLGPAEFRGQRAQRLHGAEAVGAHGVLPRCTRRHVPGARLQHQAQRLQLAFGLAAPALVAHGHAPRVPHRLGHLAQMRRRLLRAVPVHRVDVQSRAHAVGLLAPLGRQARHHLQPRRSRRRAQAQVGRGARQPGQQQRLRLRLRQPRELRAPALTQLKPALAPALAPQRHARRRELVNVAQDRAHRHLQRTRQRGRRLPAMRLQQHQDRQQAARFHLNFPWLRSDMRNA